MLLDFFPLQLFFVLCTECFDCYVLKELSFLVWFSLFMICAFDLCFFSSSIPIILRFVPFIVFQISWLFCAWIFFLRFNIFLTEVSILFLIM